MLLVMAAGAGEAEAQVRLRAAVDAGGIVTLTVTATGEAAPAGWHGLELVRRASGSCDKPVVVAEGAALPQPGGFLEVELTDLLPETHRVFRYALRPRDAAGLPLPDLDDDPDAAAHAAEGDAVAIRGTLTYLGGRSFELRGCEEGCWDGCAEVSPEDLGVTMVQMLTWTTHRTTLNVYATWADGADAAGCFAEITDVKAAPSCTALPAETRSWSALKAAYR